MNFKIFVYIFAKKLIFKKSELNSTKFSGGIEIKFENIDKIIILKFENLILKTNLDQVIKIKFYKWLINHR